MSVDEQKKNQFDEFFKIKHPISVNVIPLPDNYQSSEDGFEARMPHAFKLAGQFSSIDDSALRALKLSSPQSDTLIHFLEAQSQKIDWMLSYILEQQDDPEFRHQTLEFGAGGVIISLDSDMQLGQMVELKLFLPTEHSAVYCHGEVIACDFVEGKYHVAFLFAQIRENDQELLVRATLHLQTQQLRARNKANNPE